MDILGYLDDTQNYLINKTENYIKIFYLIYNNNQTNKENIIKVCNSSIKIKKEYIFEKNFNLLGSISADDNLLLLNYSENNNGKENILYIFVLIFANLLL